MAYKIDKNKCPQNHRCPIITICPVGAITQDGFGLPVIDGSKCIDCGKCAKMCPMKAVYNQLSGE
jgi:ferredoxin